LRSFISSFFPKKGFPAIRLPFEEVEQWCLGAQANCRRRSTGFPVNPRRQKKLRLRARKKETSFISLEIDSSLLSIVNSYGISSTLSLISKELF